MEDNKNMIVFDSTSWESIRDTIKKIKEFGEMQFGQTEEGEAIIFDVGHDGEDDTLSTSVFQSNGWVRTNIYHPADYTIEEIYRRETKA